MVIDLYNLESGDSRKRQKQEECKKLIECFEETMRTGASRNTIGSPIAEDVWFQLKNKAYLFADRNHINEQIIKEWLEELHAVIKRPEEFYKIIPSLQYRI